MTGKRDALDPAERRVAVRRRYAALATGGPCCEDSSRDASATDPRDLGYSPADLDAAGSVDASLGCGNPTGVAEIEAGDTVLDLGSGAGFDCSIVAREVGPDGHVIGVDMTPEMVERARENVARDGDPTVEFRLGEIEHLPVADASVDLVVSNCVINLSPEKHRVFEEAHRVLRPGGRLVVSDIALTAELPADLRTDPESVAACVGGAASVPELESMLTAAGFVDVSVEPKAESCEFVDEWDPDRDLSDYVVSTTITGKKPASGG
jgi:SAM-dependent methyltransferase